MVETAAPGVSVAAPATYGGVVTRGIALAVDAAIANLIVLVIAALLGLLASLTERELVPQWLIAAVAATAWAFTLTAYFSLFWSTTGQTPGLRMMGLRVVTVDGRRVHFFRALVRVIGLALALIPLGAGFIPVLFDARRRALQDLIARTVVINTPAST
jgi:uncharacterized RDD family membrane protein YckC